MDKDRVKNCAVLEIRGADLHSEHETMKESMTETYTRRAIAIMNHSRLEKFRCSFTRFG